MGTPDEVHPGFVYWLPYRSILLLGKWSRGVRGFSPISVYFWMIVWQRINELPHEGRSVCTSSRPLTSIQRVLERRLKCKCWKDRYIDTHTEIKDYPKNRTDHRTSFDIPEGLVPDVPWKPLRTAVDRNILLIWTRQQLSARDSLKADTPCSFADRPENPAWIYSGSF